MQVYRSKVVCRVCNITPRKLDYWVTTGVVAPSEVYYPKGKRRTYFLFSMRDMVKIKIVKSLRDAGVSLQQIRVALEDLRRRRGLSWQSEWLVTDGRRVYRAGDGGKVIESLAERERGQLVLWLIAFKDTQDQVTQALATKHFQPFDRQRYVRAGGGTARRYVH